MQLTAKTLFDGVYFGEAPRWREGRLWFSDFYAKTVNSLTLGGDLRLEFKIDDQPSGLGWTPDGAMLIVAMTSRRVLRRSPSGDISLHADLAEVAAFHCNDMVVDAKGRAYVGNFGFDLHAAFVSRGRASVLADHPTAKLALISPNGAVTVVADDLHFPNGTVITPDGKTLVIAETLGGRLTAFDIAPDGSLSNRRVWASTAPRAADGIALDAVRRHLGREPYGARMFPHRGGRRSVGRRYNQPGLLRLYAGRPRRQDVVHADSAEPLRGPHRSAQRPHRDCNRRRSARGSAVIAARATRSNDARGRCGKPLAAPRV